MIWLRIVSEHIIAAIDQIVNGEVNLPQGDKPELFERVREAGKGYTVIGTKYTYNSRNQLIHRNNEVRFEEYDHQYDGQGKLLTNGRSKYVWDDRGNLTKVTFPDGFGEKYTYDVLGRRTSKAQFNHKGNTQSVTNYHYQGDTWVITDETDKDGEITKSYTFDKNDRPLTITFKGQTFWYVYNGHGDVIALTDKDGKVAARYEYDAWGIVTKMYNSEGERVREGIGWIGDLNTGNGSPGSIQGPEDSTGNTEPDYHPGNGNNGTKSLSKLLLSNTSLSTKATSETKEAATSETTDETEDITTELVKENPFRYAGYYYDRKTQFYYLQVRYYDPRPGRFISEDTYEGEIEEPITLNQYAYANNNPVMYVDPTGHMAWNQVYYLGKGIVLSVKDTLKDIIQSPKALWEAGKAIANGKLKIGSLKNAILSSVKGTVKPFNYIKDHSNKVWTKDPTNKEVQTYGKNLGEILQMAVGSAPAIKVVSKVAPKLGKFLKKVNDKKKKKCNCFVAGTKVLTEDGEKPIEEIKIGDKVLSKDAKTGKKAYKKVLQLFQHDDDKIYTIYVGNQKIEATGNHPFWVEGKGWVLVEDLMVGDILLQSDGKKLKIDKIDFEHRIETVYNFEVEDYHTYFVSDLRIWVHNENSSCTINKKISKRIEYMGKTPGKSSKAGKAVISRMEKEHKIRVNRMGGEEFKSTNGKWYPIKEADMAHKIDAVSWWNKTGRNYGAKSKKVREWMLNPDNYELEHFKDNRSKGAKLKENYLPPKK